MMRIGLLFMLGLGLLSACEDGKQRTLPDALASSGDLVVISDKGIWNGKVGEAVRKTFASEQPGLPQSEPWFKLLHFEEGKFNGITQRYRSILLLTTLDNASKTSRFIKELVGEKQYSQSLNDSNLLFIQSEDRWANGQKVMYVIGKDEASLARAITQRSISLRELLNKSELERTIKYLKNRPRNTSLEKEVAAKTGLQLYLPQSYRSRVLTDSFVWVSRELDDKTLNVFVGIRPYTSENQFFANAVLAYKDSLTRQFVPGPTPNSWYTTEYMMPIDTQAVVFSGQYALKMRGLWKVENDFMGGPFVNMTVYDVKRNRLLHLEGFVYYPKEKKRELLRELEGILASLQF